MSAPPDTVDTRRPTLATRRAADGPTGTPDVAGGGPAAGHRTGGWSAEVQALRAVAVLLVVGFHLWPGALPGGYVGVDVFFVISGFLISGHILRDLERGRFTLRGFYVRRAQRLLPAALVVLLVVAVAVVLVEPRTRWIGSGQQLLASVGYVQNWVLALSDVDYLSPASPPTAVQHFWSLSVEEQFYFVWPVLLMAAGGLAARHRPQARRAVLAGVMAVVALASFAHGVRLTASEPTKAYFFSTTRIWEFAAGALLVLLLRPSAARPAVRGVLAWAGLAAIGASALLYTQRTPFPGWAALLPVAGTIAFLAAGRSDWRWSPGVLVRLRPAQFFGDVSYSLYLWHWPVVVLLPQVLGQPRLTFGQKLFVLPLTVLAAWLSMRYVENRFRPGRAGTPPVSTPARTPAGARPTGPRTLPVVAALTAAVVLVAVAAVWTVRGQIAQAQLLAGQTAGSAVPCFGAAALGRDCEPPYGPDVVVPDPAGALEELRGTYARDRCFTGLHRATVRTCSFGDPAAPTHVVLLGDSHALQWVPALTPLLADRGWRLTTMLRASCTPNQALMYTPSQAQQDTCAAWARDAVDTIARDASVDLVITSAYDNKRWVPAPGLDPYWTGVRGYEQTWRRFTATGARVVVLHDTPRPLPGVGRVQECVADDPAAATCARKRDTATRGSAWRDGRDDAMSQAVRELADPRVRLVDLTDSFCLPDRCPAVIGNVLVYADDNHITPTYARTLSPTLGKALDAVLPASSTSLR